MQRQVAVIGPDASVALAACMMRDRDVGCLPVIEDGRLIGMITDRDIVVRGIAEGLNPHHALVREAMSANAIACSLEHTVEQASEATTTCARLPPGALICIKPDRESPSFQQGPGPPGRGTASMQPATDSARHDGADDCEADRIIDRFRPPAVCQSRMGYDPVRQPALQRRSRAPTAAVRDWHYRRSRSSKTNCLGCITRSGKRCPHSVI
jgi:hypothetical protein